MKSLPQLDHQRGRELSQLQRCGRRTPPQNCSVRTWSPLSGLGAARVPGWTGLRTGHSCVQRTASGGLFQRCCHQSMAGGPFTSDRPRSGAAWLLAVPL